MNELAWAYRFAAVVRPAVLQFYGPRSCIESTRVGVAVARYFGRTFVPAAVAAQVCTRDWWDFPDPDKVGAPGWSVGTTGDGAMDEAGNRWEGHLVGVLDDEYLVDLSADQFSRPERGIPIPGPIVFPCTMAQLAGGVAIAGRANTVYAAKATADLSYRRAGGWTRHEHIARKATALAIRTLKPGVIHSGG